MAVAERQELSFNTLFEVVSYVGQLVQCEVRTSGNHSFGQILNHLALSLDMSSGKIEAPRTPFMMRVMMPLIRSFVLNPNKPLKPGIKLPKKSEDFFWPDRDFDVQDAFDHFKQAVHYYAEAGPLEKHPVFGKLTPEQNLSLNCRHCALHLSFVHPA